jgi:hypothetical protein
MSPIRVALACLIVLVGLPPAVAGSRPRIAAPRLLRVVNATFDSVNALAVAPAGGDIYTDLPLDPPLQGGRSEAVVRLPAGNCLRDFRVTFRNGRSSTLPAIDVCRGRGLRLETQPHA